MFDRNGAFTIKNDGTSTDKKITRCRRRRKDRTNRNESGGDGEMVEKYC